MCDPRQIGMKKFTILFFITLFAYGQQQKDSFTIESLFNKSAKVFFGEVIDKQSYWDVEHKMIYTVHKVKVSKSYKGNSNQFEYVLKKGGTVGLQGVIVKPNIRINKESSGFFMVKNLSSVELDGFSITDKFMVLSSGINGFLSYDSYDKSVRIPGKPKKSLSTFENELEKLSKKKIKLVDGLLNHNIFVTQTAISSASISSISPLSIAAGNKEVLTIKGNGFGEFILDDSFGRVSFSNADSGGNSWVNSLKTQIVSWSDTEIKVEVPSDSGSGLIRIVRSNGTIIESSQAIEIPYSIQSIIYPENGEQDEQYEYPIYHAGSITDDILENGEVKDNISNGAYNFTLNKGFYDNVDARDAFDYHLKDWVCSTGLNFNIDENTTPKSGAFSDYNNIVSFGDIDALGVTYSYFDGCVIRDGDDNIVDLQIVWNEIDIVFNESVSWGYNEVQYNEYDFNSVAKHEIGHALGFGHNINSNSLMHYNVSTGQQTTSIDSYLDGAAAILQRDVSISLCDELDPHQIAECSTIDPDLDSDQDGINDIFDICPETPLGYETNNKGCSDSQLDYDDDGVTNDLDQCPGTPSESVVDAQGCADSDNDGVTDNIDICNNTELYNEVNEQGCAAYQRDTDNDGVTDDFDECDNTPETSTVDVNGCPVFTLPSNNFNIFVQSLSCIDSNDGSIEVSVLDKSFTYEVRIAENYYPLSIENEFKYVIDDLSVGIYDICFSVDGNENYEQCFQINLGQPLPLEVYSSLSLNEVRFEVEGSIYYNVNHNGQEMIFHENIFEIPLNKGINNIRISTDLDCQGVYEETILNGNQVFVHPSITKDYINLVIEGLDSIVEVIIHDFRGRKLANESVFFSNKRSASFSVKDLPKGVYFLTFQSPSIQQTSKIIKK